MSGTSLDGIDLVYVSFDESSYQDFEILEAVTISYSKEWKEILQKSIFRTFDELKSLDISYGKYLGNVIKEFIKNHKIINVDFIASHGHTVLHQPEKGITLQIGSGEEIANVTGKKVVCDFRIQDVKLGGQGAPLVPVGDELLFSNYSFCINLGGFSNISYQQNNERIAFDICPVNIVLNHYVNKLGFEYDDEGKIAVSGEVNEELLSKLNQLNFYQIEPPKSLGLEWVQQYVFPLIDGFNLEIKDILRTFVEHIAVQISSIIKSNSSVLFTGGGVFNLFLIERIEFYSQSKYLIPNQQLINFKEALIFSLLGLLRIKNEINCLKSVTGATKNHSSGVVFKPL